MKDQFFLFLKESTPDLSEVVDFLLKNEDDEHGAIGEHYIVKCLLYQTRLAKMLEDKSNVTKKICLIKKLTFDNWLNKKESIIWI